MDQFLNALLILNINLSNYEPIDQTLITYIINTSLAEYPISHILTGVSANNDLNQYSIDFRINYYNILLNQFNYTEYEKKIISNFLLSKSFNLDFILNNNSVRQELLEQYLPLFEDNTFQTTHAEVEFFYNNLILFVMQLLAYNLENYNNGTILNLSHKITQSWEQIVQFNVYEQHQMV